MASALRLRWPEQSCPLYVGGRIEVQRDTGVVHIDIHYPGRVAIDYRFRALFFGRRQQLREQCPAEDCRMAALTGTAGNHDCAASALELGDHTLERRALDQRMVGKM